MYVHVKYFLHVNIYSTIILDSPRPEMNPNDHWLFNR